MFIYAHIDFLICICAYSICLLVVLYIFLCQFMFFCTYSFGYCKYSEMNNIMNVYVCIIHTWHIHHCQCTYITFSYVSMDVFTYKRHMKMYRLGPILYGIVHWSGRILYCT